MNKDKELLSKINYYLLNLKQLKYTTEMYCITKGIEQLYLEHNNKMVNKSFKQICEETELILMKIEELKQYIKDFNNNKCNKTKSRKRKCEYNEHIITKRKRNY